MKKRNSYNKYLITGASGFVSKYFISYLEENKINSSILGIDINIPDFLNHNFKYVDLKFEKINLLDKNITKDVITHFKPDYILHLASCSSVYFSWKNPVISFQNNTGIFLNIIDIMRELNIKCRILSIGSSEEYGNLAEKDLPVKEDFPLKPVSPYAVSRVSMELLSKIYVEGYGLDIVMTRSFNHVGPCQKDIFVVPSFAKQLVNIKQNLSPKLYTGDINIIRDFVDVRDVVDAYYKLLKNGKMGEIYNVCSGKGISLREIIESMSEILDIKVKIEVDANLLRPSDNKIIIGDNSKIKKDVHWENNISLKQSLTDILNFWYNSDNISKTLLCSPEIPDTGKEQ